MTAPVFSEIYLANAAQIELSEACLGLLPPERRERVLSCGRPEKARQIAAGGLLLRFMLCRHGAEDKAETGLSCEQDGKPCLPGADLFFNLSHSGDYAVGIITNAGPVGIDVERVRRFPAGLDGAFFSKREPDADSSPEEQTDSWTRREALLKCIGCGWNLPPGMELFPLREDVIRRDNHIYHLKTMHPYPGYSLSICQEVRS